MGRQCYSPVGHGRVRGRGGAAHGSGGAGIRGGISSGGSMGGAVHTLLPKAVVHFMRCSSGACAMPQHAAPA